MCSIITLSTGLTHVALHLVSTVFGWLQLRQICLHTDETKKVCACVCLGGGRGGRGVRERGGGRERGVITLFCHAFTGMY